MASLRGYALLLVMLPCGLASHSSCSAVDPEAALHASALLQRRDAELGRTAVAAGASRAPARALREDVNASASHNASKIGAEGALVQLSEPLLSYWDSSLQPLLWNMSALLGVAVLLSTFRANSSSKGDSSTGYVKSQAVGASLGTEALTGFRCLLTLWVFFYHLDYTWIEGSGGFIVLAGCVLSASRRKEPGRVKEPFAFDAALLRFYAARYVRIMPLFWVASLAIKPTLYQGETHNPLSFLRRAAENFNRELHDDPARVLICSHPEAEEWFLQAILVCYLFYPLLERIMLGHPEQEAPKARRLLLIAAVAVAVKAGVIIVAALYFGDHLEHDRYYEVPVPWLGGLRLYSFPVFRLPDFALGAMVPHLSLSSDLSCRLSLISDALFLMLVLTAVTTAFVGRNAIAQLFFELQIQGPVWAFALWGFCFAGQTSPVGRALGSCYPMCLAKTSYGVYLIHLPVASALGFSWGVRPQASHVATILAATILISWATAVLVEDTIERFVKPYLR